MKDPVKILLHHPFVGTKSSRGRAIVCKRVGWGYEVSSDSAIAIHVSVASSRDIEARTISIDNRKRGGTVVTFFIRQKEDGRCAELSFIDTLEVKLYVEE